MLITILLYLGFKNLVEENIVQKNQNLNISEIKIAPILQANIERKNWRP